MPCMAASSNVMAKLATDDLFQAGEQPRLRSHAHFVLHVNMPLVAL